MKTRDAPLRHSGPFDAACAAKEALTASDSVEVEYLQWRGVLTRELFDTLIEPMVAQSLKAWRRAVRDARTALYGAGRRIL